MCPLLRLHRVRAGPFASPREEATEGMQRQIGARDFDFDRQVAVMAIINRTPDSFFDKGATFSDQAARDAVHRAVAEGADVIDVGGVKAGPGQNVDTDTEIARLVPFIEWLRDAYPDQLVSVDRRFAISHHVVTCEQGKAGQMMDDVLVVIRNGDFHTCSTVMYSRSRRPQPNTGAW